MHLSLKSFFRIAVTLTFSWVLGAGAFAGESSDWPNWRGPSADGIAPQSGAFNFAPGGYGLKVVWKKPLGSAYSSISVANGSAITMFSDKKFDYVIAFDANTGDEQWRFQFDSTYVGHDGSHDGPISTPLVTSDKVFVVGPRGHLLALDAATGKKVWSAHLADDFRVKAPLYGLATSPQVSGNVLLLQVGASDSTMLGLNPADGKVLWTAGNDTISYQSPVLMNLAGRQQLVCLANHRVLGMDPADGKILWEHRHGGRGGTSSPVAAGGNRIFVHAGWENAVMLEVTENSGEFSAKELWKNSNIKATYNVPVYFEEHLYGYSGSFLTCLNAATGESVWKSRQPGDGFMIGVDGHLVILTKKGSLHVGKASPAGYKDLASLSLFADQAWTPASFANGRIYARSLGEIASVEVGPVDQVLAAGPQKPVAPPSDFNQFIGKLKNASNKQPLIDEFMSAQKAFPIIEGDNLVHFVYRGDAKDLAVSGDMLGDHIEEPMKHVADTDFFYFTMQLKPDACVKYRFVKNFEKAIADTLNPRRIPTIDGEFSLLSMPKWSEPKHLSEPTNGMARGRIDTLRFTSKIVESSRRLDIYLPSGYDQSETRYPVAYVNWGDLAKDWGKMPTSLDNLIDHEVAPVIVVFIPHKAPQDFSEFFGKGQQQYAQMLAEELVPFIDQHYRTIASAETRLIVGPGFTGTPAFHAALKHPGVFGNIATQSMFLLTADENELKKMTAEATKQPLRIYMDWGTYDYRSPVENWDIGKSNQHMAEFFRDKGHTVTGMEVNEGFDFANWRNRTDKIFATFFPLAQAKR